MERNYREIKNFLPDEEFKALRKIMFSKELPWYYRNEQTFSDRFYFNHSFYQWYTETSDLFEYVKPILHKLKVNMLSEVRANLILKDKEHHQSGWHCDRDFDCNTAIFYMNTNNGHTLLGEKNSTKIECEENKMLIFNSKIKHCAVSQTNKVRRIVININYV